MTRPDVPDPDATLARFRARWSPPDGEPIERVVDVAAGRRETVTLSVR